MKIADCLPAKLLALCRYLDKLDQIRIVANKPVKVSLEGATYYVGKNGLQNGPCDAICVGDEEVGDLVKTACQNSIYAFERQLGNGYLTLDDGSRIGVSGKGFVDKNGQVFFSDYKGVCIRMNRHVVGCSGVVGSDMLSSSVSYLFTTKGMESFPDRYS